jgi:hypothetical protein
VHLNDALGDGETETRPALFAGRRAVRLLKLLEDFLLVRGRYPRAGITDRDFKRALPGRGTDRDFAGVGEFDRIPNQIKKDLSYPPFVTSRNG